MRPDRVVDQMIDQFRRNGDVQIGYLERITLDDALDDLTAEYDFTKACRLSLCGDPWPVYRLLMRVTREYCALFADQYESHRAKQSNLVDEYGGAL